MAELIYSENPEDRTAMRVSVRRKLRRNVAFLSLALTAGLLISGFLAFILISRGPLDAVLAATMGLLWAVFIGWHFRSLRKWASQMLEDTWISSSHVQLRGVEGVIALEGIEEVFWNPDLPFFVIEKRGEAESRYVVVRKGNFAKPEELRKALERKIRVVETPNKDLHEIKAEWLGTRRRKTPSS